MSEATFRRTADLADGFGAGEVRAEDLIAASKQSVSPELRTAQLLDRNEKATDELDWDKAAKVCEVKVEMVLDAVVRGDYIILVVESEQDNRPYKVVGSAADAGVEVSPSAKRKAAQRAKSKAKAKAEPKAKAESKTAESKE